MAIDFSPRRQATYAPQAAPLLALLIQMVLVTGIALAVGGGAPNPATWATGLACALVTNWALAHGLSHFRTERLSRADRVTLVRASLAVGVAALVADAFAARVPATAVVAVAATALALDAVDGWVARRSATSGRLGELTTARSTRS
jgi:hypothetical protein